MALDLKTVYFVSCLVFAFVGCSTLFYALYRKTYPGFGYWVASAFSLTLGNLLIFLRPLLPLWFSITFSNCFSLLAVLLGLDGSLRFFEGKNLAFKWYAGSLTLLAVFANYFAFVEDRLDIRVRFISALAFLFLMAWVRVLFRQPAGPQRKFARAVGVLLFVWGVLLLWRAAAWDQVPQLGLLTPTPSNYSYYLSILLIEMGFGMAIIMLNNSRVEEELHSANRELDLALRDLTNTMAQLKVLTGIIPICSHCKRIRDDDTNVWSQLEEYISTHSNADFSHGICPSCLKEHYPEYRPEPAKPNQP